MLPDIFKTPWIDSPFFYEILKRKKKNSFQKKVAIEMHEQGYSIINLGISNKIIDKLNRDIKSLVISKNYKTNPKYYHYNKSPRIVEAWKYSKNVSMLAKNKKILYLLKFLFDSKPIPFSTINFIKGTEQPLHSDYIHFGSIPERYLVGVWVALENINLRNGPLYVLPKSHKMPLIRSIDLKLKKPTNITQLKNNNSKYEKIIKDFIKINSLKTKKIIMKKGQAIIWSANLLHGGYKMKDIEKTRLSQVTHYHFKNCKFYYNPSFSEYIKNNYAKRKLEIIK